MQKSAAHNRLRRVRDEFFAVKYALAETLRLVQTDAFAAQVSIAQNLSIGEFHRAISNVEQTYLIRLFTEFEGIAVHYYRYGLKRRSRNPKIAVVMAVLHYRHNIDPTTFNEADEVRDMRNALVHTGQHSPPLDFATSAKRLGRFLHWLPQTWPDF